MNIRRYIDYAVKREIRRVFHRDGALDIIKQINSLVLREPDNLGASSTVKQSLKVLTSMVESPNVTSPDKLIKNKIHFATLLSKAIGKVASTVFSAQAERLATSLVKLFNQEKQNAFGSSTPLYKLNPAEEEMRKNRITNYNNVSQREYNLTHSTGDFQGKGKGLSFQERAKQISKQTGLPVNQVLKEILKNNHK